jgi:conjugal transfer ATP-binding protein TraC
MLGSFVRFFEKQAPRSKVRGDSSLTMKVPQWELSDGVLVAESGVLEAGIEVRIPSTRLLDSAVAESMHLGWMATLRSALPQGERLRLYVEAAPISESVLSEYGGLVGDAHPAAVELSRRKVESLLAFRKSGVLMEFRVYVLFTTRTRKRGKRKAFLKEEFAEYLKAAMATRQRLLSMLSRMGLRPRPMGSQDLFTLAYRYFNPHLRTLPVPKFVPTRLHLKRDVLERNPSFADRTLRSQLVKSDMPLRSLQFLNFAEHYWSFLTMRKLPVGNTFTGMLDHLLRSPHTFWLVLDFFHNQQASMLRGLTTKARRFSSAASDTTFSDYADASTRVGLEETDGAVMYANSTGSHFFDFGVSMVVLGGSREEVEVGVQHVMSEFSGVAGLEVVRESLGLLEQFVALSPGSGRNNETTFSLLDGNVAAFVPSHVAWSGSGRPVVGFWNQFDGFAGLDPFDPRSSNWNGIVVGGSGSGKTFFMQVYLSELLRQDADVIIVDRGYGYRHLVELFDGVLIPVEPQNGVSVNPFDLEPGVFFPDEGRKAFLAAVIKTMLGAKGGSGSGSQDGVIDAAITQAYARATSQRRNKVSGEVETVFEGVRLSNFVHVLNTLEEVGDRSISDIERRVAKQMVADLQGWTGDTALGSFIDRPTNVSSDAKVVYYETTGLEANPQLRAVGVLLIADLVWRRVQADPSRRKIVVFDEMWSLLKIPEAAAFVVELYRRFRRYNAAAYSVTQSLQDFLTPEARGILQNTNYHFLLRLAGEDDVVREVFNLSDNALVAHRGLVSKRGSFSEFLCWVRREDGVEGDVLVLRPIPYEYWLFTTHPSDMLLRSEALSKFGFDLGKALEWLVVNFPKGADSG